MIMIYIQEIQPTWQSGILFHLTSKSENTFEKLTDLSVFGKVIHGWNFVHGYNECADVDGFVSLSLRCNRDKAKYPHIFFENMLLGWIAFVLKTYNKIWFKMLLTEVQFWSRINVTKYCFWYWNFQENIVCSIKTSNHRLKSACKNQEKGICI